MKRFKVFFVLGCVGLALSFGVARAQLPGSPFGGGSGSGAVAGAYDADTWDGNTDAPTKDAVRDKIETLAAGHDAVTINAGIGAISLTGANQVLTVHANLEVLADFADPNADRIWFWDDTAGAFAGLAVGNSIVITDTTMDTVQDIRTTATPQFARIGVGQAADATNPIASSGFSVDPDGDVVAKSLTITRVAGSASSSDFFEVPANGDNKVTVKAPDTLSADHVMTLPSATVTIPNNPIGGTLGATTNVIPKANGTGTATLQASGITEDGTSVSLGALNLVTTGTIQGGMVISSDADGMDGAAMTAAGMYGTLFIATGAGTWTLPTAVAGMFGCLADSGTAHDLILDVQADDDIQLKGTEQANGVGITNAAGTTTGDFVCFVAISAGHWMTLGMQGTWASQ